MKNDRQVLSSEYDKEQTNIHLHGRFSFTKWDKVKSYPPNYTSYSFAADSALQTALSRSNVQMHTISRHVSAFTHAHHIFLNIFIILDVCGFFLGITWILFYLNFVFHTLWLVFCIKKSQFIHKYVVNMKIQKQEQENESNPSSDNDIFQWNIVSSVMFFFAFFFLSNFALNNSRSVQVLKFSASDISTKSNKSPTYNKTNNC